MAAVVTGHADLHLGTKLLARLARVAIFLPQMDPIGVQPLGKADAVIDDEGDLALGTERLDRPGERGDGMIVDPFEAQLEGGDLAAVERLGELIDEILVNRRRRNQIELAGRAKALFELLGKMGVERQFFVSEWFVGSFESDERNGACWSNPVAGSVSRPLPCQHASMGTNAVCLGTAIPRRRS